MKKLKIAMVVHKEEGRYWASFPELPGCFTRGDTLDDLRKNALEAVTGHLEALQEEGRPLPETGITVEAVEAVLEGAA